MKTSKKVLVDNLGRVVGLIAPRTGKIGNNIEYGGVRDGVLDVRGIARIERKSIDNYEIEHLRIYDGNTGRLINSSAAAAMGSIKSPRKTATSRENGKKGGRPRGINLSTLIDRYGANGVIRIDAGNGSAGPAWIEWDNEMKKEIGKIKMIPVSPTDKAYEDEDDDSTVEHEAQYVVNDYSCDNNTMYASAWIEDDDRNAPYQAQNPYRYRLIF